LSSLWTPDCEKQIKQGNLATSRYKNANIDKNAQKRKGAILTHATSNYWVKKQQNSKN
jgi:hypothetical protein